jgi:hypothetical protein
MGAQEGAGGLQSTTGRWEGRMKGKSDGEGEKREPTLTGLFQTRDGSAGAAPDEKGVRGRPWRAQLGQRRGDGDVFPQPTSSVSSFEPLLTSFLIIHSAQAEHNVAEDYSIRDAPLTKLGREQSANLREATEGTFQKDAELLVTSPVRLSLFPS